MALDALNLYGALSIALVIPDICGSLEDPGPNKSRKRYTAWVDKWVIPNLPVMPGDDKPLISAADYFQLRCSLIHSGSAEIPVRKDSNLREFIFCDRTVGSHMLRVTGSGVARIQLVVDLFCADLFWAAHQWDLSVADNQAIQAEKEKLLVIHSGSVNIDGIVLIE